MKREMTAARGTLKCQARATNPGGAVSITAPTGPVRGLFRPRPWAGPCPSVDRAAPETRRHPWGTMNTSAFHFRMLFAGLAAGLSLVFALGAAAAPTWPGASVASYQGVLNGVSAVSSTDVWAVGGSLILHWNGSAWAKVPDPNPNSTSNLSAVSARSPSEAWAVGSYCTSGCNSGSRVFQALLLRWNGTAWTRVVSPEPRGAVSSFLQGVSVHSPSDAWAVGYYCASAPCYTFGPAVLHTLILHWNGTRWTVVRSPDPGGTNGSSLNAVSALSTSNAWAFGSYGPCRPLPASARAAWGRKVWCCTGTAATGPT